MIGRVRRRVGKPFLCLMVTVVTLSSVSWISRKDAKLHRRGKKFVWERKWDKAVELSHMLQPLVDAVFAPPIRKYRARLKACLYLQGIIPNKVVRSPLVEVPDKNLDYWRQVLRVAGLDVKR